MIQALSNRGWQQDESDFIRDTGIYFKMISKPLFKIILKYKLDKKELWITIYCRGNSISQDLILHDGFLRNDYIRVLNLIKYHMNYLSKLTYDKAGRLIKECNG